MGPILSIFMVSLCVGFLQHGRLICTHFERECLPPLDFGLNVTAKLFVKIISILKFVFLEYYYK